MNAFCVNPPLIFLLFLSSEVADKLVIQIFREIESLRKALNSLRDDLVRAVNSHEEFHKQTITWGLREQNASG